MDLGQGRLGLGAPGLALPGQAVAVLLEDRPPPLVGLLLSLGFGLLGGEQVGLDPAVAGLLVAQLLPGRLAPGVEAGHRAVVRLGLLAQPRVLAPAGELPLIVGPIGRGGPAFEVFAQEGLGLGIVLDLAADLFGPLPFSAVEDQA